MGDELPAVSLHVDRAAIARYAEISADFNPIHVDEEFALRSPLGGLVAHGMLSLNLLWRAIELALGPEAGGAELDVRFRAPVRAGDSVTAGGRRLSGAEFEVWVENQHGVRVIEGRAQLPAAGKVESPDS